MAVPGRRFQQNDLRCDLCDDNRQAVGYCLQCCECLCAGCEIVHSRSRASKLHEILPKEDIPPEFFDENNVCGEHGNETVIYFCAKHQEPCCFKCLVSPKHKGCDLQPIDDIAKDFEKCTEYKNVISSIKDLSKKLDGVKKESVKYHRETEESIARSKTDVQNFQGELQKELSAVGSGLVNELDIQTDLNDKDRENTSRFCTDSRQELTKLEKLLRFLEKQKWIHRLMLTSKLASRKITQIEKDLRQTGRIDLQYKSKVWSFEPNRDSCEMMQRRDTLGKIKVQEKVRGNMMWRLFYGFRNVLHQGEKRRQPTKRDIIYFLLGILTGILFCVFLYHAFILSFVCDKNSECHNCVRLLRRYDDDGVRQLYRHYGDDTVPRCKDFTSDT